MPRVIGRRSFTEASAAWSWRRRWPALGCRARRRAGGLPCAVALGEAILKRGSDVPASIQRSIYCTYFSLLECHNFGEDDTVASTKSWHLFGGKSVQEISSTGRAAQRQSARPLELRITIQGFFPLPTTSPMLQDHFQNPCRENAQLIKTLLGHLSKPL